MSPGLLYQAAKSTMSFLSDCMNSTSNKLFTWERDRTASPLRALTAALTYSSAFQNKRGQCSLMSPFSRDNELESERAFPLFKDFIHRGDVSALAHCSAELQHQGGKDTCVLISRYTCCTVVAHKGVSRDRWIDRQVDGWMDQMHE